MADPIIRSDWSKGINNRSHWKGLAREEMRDAVNVDPLPGGKLGLRAGFTQVVEASDVRGTLSVGQFILIAAGSNLLCYDTETNSVSTLSTNIAGSGRFAGAVLNEELFFCTENLCYRFKDGVLRDWGVNTISLQPLPQVVAGGLSGEYLLAATFVDANGDEGGSINPLLVVLPDNGGVLVDLPTPPAGCTVRLYMGPRQGETLYLQAQGVATALVTSVDTSTARLMTQDRRAPGPADMIAEHNGVLALGDGKVVWLTEALRPHLVSYGDRFFQFPLPVDGIMSAHGGLFVLADRTYFISEVETAQPQLAVVLPYGGVRGTMIRSPGNEACWMTKYGLARTTGPGQAQLLSKDRFLPALGSKGGSGVLERNGNQLVVTTMHRAQGDNVLRASDYYEGEIV